MDISFYGLKILENVMIDFPFRTVLVMTSDFKHKQLKSQFVSSLLCVDSAKISEIAQKGKAQVQQGKPQLLNLWKDNTNHNYQTCVSTFALTFFSCHNDLKNYLKQSEAAKEHCQQSTYDSREPRPPKMWPRTFEPCSKLATLHSVGHTSRQQDTHKT